MLKQHFTATAPNQKWVDDITYLAVLIALYSRKVIGWATNERMTADLAVEA